MNWNPFTSVVDLVGNVAGAVKAKWELMQNSWYQKQLDAAHAAKEAKAAAAQLQADQRAVLDDDAEALARRIKEHRKLLAVPLAACLALAVSGCAMFRPQVVVVPQEDVPVALVHNGQAGYWISKPVLMMYIEIADKYEAAKKAGKL